MWTCPKCGRSFRNCNQSHSCGKAPETIEEYILGQPEELQPVLRHLQETIREAIPNAKEKISWSMPTFWKGRNLIQFAASQKHIGLYPGPEAVEAFADRLASFPTSKGTIRLPLNQPMPLELIADIARWCEEKYGNQPKKLPTWFRPWRGGAVRGGHAAEYLLVRGSRTQ